MSEQKEDVKAQLDYIKKICNDAVNEGQLVFYFQKHKMENSLEEIMIGGSGRNEDYSSDDFMIPLPTFNNDSSYDDEFYSLGDDIEKYRNPLADFFNSLVDDEEGANDEEHSVDPIWDLKTILNSLNGIYIIEGKGQYVNLKQASSIPSFGVSSIKSWWHMTGKKLYKNLKYGVVIAKEGISNNARSNVWKYEMQRLADFFKIPIQFCYCPLRTFNWKKPKLRLLASYICTNWKGEISRSYENNIFLISHAFKEENWDPKYRIEREKFDFALSVGSRAFQKIRTTPSKFQGKWNYVLHNSNHKIDC
ncbi:MAG: hypothetical protein LBE38_06995 [Deltaproteobacteria bacterium]|nr:hypothetical protein [Deltaproteobacteria bacterium]